MKTRYNYDGMSSVFILMLFAIVILLSSCRMSQESVSTSSVINFKPDYDNDLVDAEVVQHGDTTFYYDMDPRDIRELMNSMKDNSVTVYYKEKGE